MEPRPTQAIFDSGIRVLRLLSPVARRGIHNNATVVWNFWGDNPVVWLLEQGDIKTLVLAYEDGNPQPVVIHTYNAGKDGNWRHKVLKTLHKDVSLDAWVCLREKWGLYERERE